MFNLTVGCAGFEGPTCAIDIDECASNPCLNHGVCRDRFNGYECACVNGKFTPTCSL